VAWLACTAGEDNGCLMRLEISNLATHPDHTVSDGPGDNARPFV
jgi:hypothetical protein